MFYITLLSVSRVLKWILTHKGCDVVFRKAELCDLDAICAIYDAIHDREEAGLTTVGWIRSIYPTRATAEASILAKDMFVLEVDGDILAAARINQVQGEEYKEATWQFPCPDSKVMVLHTLVVSPAAARKGWGTQFVAFYEDYAARHGCTCLRMDTNARNTVARALYKKLGYTEVCVVPCVFNGIAGVQLVCLEKTL
jgi:GNAT superfamily N-acetyltransferase